MRCCRYVARQPKNMVPVIEEVEMCKGGAQLVLDRKPLYIGMWT